MSILPPLPDLGGPRQQLLTVEHLSKRFVVRGQSLFNRRYVNAVTDVSFVVGKGETLGVVGESGCGKSTTARLLLKLMPSDSGQIIFDGQSIGDSLSLRDYRRSVQMVFQDSYGSLNPRMTIEETLCFGPQSYGVSAQQARKGAAQLLERVGLLPERFAARYPHELSGGQRQRVNIARALAYSPRLLVLDESVSALDKSVEAQVLNLLNELKTELGLTYIFISHDLNVVRYMSDRIMVMYLGKIVEVGPAQSLWTEARHPYTRALLASMPPMDPSQRITRVPIEGDPPSPIDPPSGCRFHPRCSRATSYCAKNTPALSGSGEGDFSHQVACFFPIFSSNTVTS